MVCLDRLPPGHTSKDETPAGPRTMARGLKRLDAIDRWVAAGTSFRTLAPFDTKYIKFRCRTGPKPMFEQASLSACRRSYLPAMPYPAPAALL
jgi:hypothetical protein